MEFEIRSTISEDVRVVYDKGGQVCFCVSNQIISVIWFGLVRLREKLKSNQISSV